MNLVYYTSQKKMLTILVICFLFLPYFVAPEESSVYEYNPTNFKNQIEEMDGNFIMFYAPWCRHCTEFHPIWFELAELVNTKDSKFAIAQVDCTLHSKLCHENDITGYPTLLYFHRNTFTPVEYKGTRDLPSLTLFLSEVFAMKSEKLEVVETQTSDVKIYSGMAYLNDQNVEKYISKGQHFIMFYTPWCKASQNIAPVWAELAAQFAHNEYLQIGKVNCMENEMTCKNFDIKQYPYLLWIVNGRIKGQIRSTRNRRKCMKKCMNVDEAKEVCKDHSLWRTVVSAYPHGIQMGVADVTTLEDLKLYVEKMVLAENHDPVKFMKKKKALPVARISEETFETFLEKDLVFINYFAPWCAHCMQLSPLWLQLGEKFQNESRVLIADVDCVRSKPICETEKINGLPTLILYKKKKVVTIEHGGRPLESLITLVTEHLQETTPDETADELTHTKDEL